MSPREQRARNQPLLVALLLLVFIKGLVFSIFTACWFAFWPRWCLKNVLTLNLRQMSKLWQKWKRKTRKGWKRPKWIKNNTTYYMTNPGYWKVQMTGSRKGLLNPVTEPHKSALVCFWKLNEKPSLALKPKDKCSRPDWHTCRVVGLRLFSCWILSCSPDIPELRASCQHRKIKNGCFERKELEWN